MFNFLKRKKPLLTKEDNSALRELERTAYLEEAKKLVVARGQRRAKDDIQNG